MHRLDRVCLCLLFAAATSCGSTSGALVQLPFRAGGQAAGPLTFTTQSGWTVTLQKAQIALGPFYFNNAPATQEGFRNGLVIIQVTQQVVVDVLDPTLRDVPGGADGETGRAVSVEIQFLPPDKPPSLQITQGGDVGSVAGIATKGTTTIQFSGPITIDTNSVTATQPLVSLQRVRGAQVDLDFTTAPQAIELQVDPTHWFDAADFSLVTNGTWDVRTQDGERFLNLLLQGVKQDTRVYLFRLVPR